MVRKKKAKYKVVRQGILLDYLRRQITNGLLLPGRQLPTHQEVQDKFGATRVTVQRAFDQLAADGFIRTVPKVGRFVADRPPHLSQYALVFCNAPVEGSFPNWGRFEDALLEASRAVASQDGIQFSTYYSVNSHVDSEGYQALMRDMEARRLAGICFAFTPHELGTTPLLERTSPPMVAPGEDWDHPIPGRHYDSRYFIYRALDAFEAHGRRRIAVITTPWFAWGFPDEFNAAVESRGMEFHPFWMQAVDPHRPYWVRHAVHAILSAHPSRVPDALLITDDHLVEAVSEAIQELGVRAPDDLRVIGHWNFPLRYRGSIPIDLLGFDAHELLRMWVSTVDAQRRGERVPSIAMIPPRFASELQASQVRPYTSSDRQ